MKLNGKWTRRILYILLSTALILASFSCTSSSDDDDDSWDGTFLLKGSLSVEGEFTSVQNTEPESRTAVPVIPTLYYTVEAVKTGSTENYSAVVNDATFEIKLTTGTWTLTAKGYCDEAKTKQCFKGTTTVTLEPLVPVVDDIEITVKPHQTGTGSVNLALNIEQDCGITTAIAEWNSTTQTLDFSSGTSANLTMNGTVSSSAYTVSFKFYGSKNELLYYCRETVNVFDNLKTDTWINNGNKLYLTEDSEGNTIFKITKELIENFKMTSFFVQGTGGTYKPHLDAADTNNGTYFDPLATVQKAAQKCADRSKTTPCSIFIDGIVTEESAVVIEEDGKVSIIAFSENAEIKTAASLNPLIETSGLLTIENIKTDGNITYSSGSLTLKGTTTLGTITLNSAGLWITADGLSEETVAKVTMTNETASYADIIYKKGSTILKPANETTLTQADCNKFPLTSPYFVLMEKNGVGILTSSEGKITPEIKKEISFTLDNKDGETPAYARGDTITVSASLTDSDGTKSDCTEDMTEWKISITNHGSDTGTSNTSSTDNTVTIPDGTTAIKDWPEDTYTVTVSAKYKTENVVYDASFDIEITE